MMTNITKTVSHEDAGDRSLLVVTAEMRVDDELWSDGFSITAKLYEAHGTWSGAARRRNGKDADVYGCQHDEILRRLPHLAPLVTVHLADSDGVPMHALSNGWYFYSGNDRGPGYANRDNLSDHARAARALHIDEKTLPHGMCKTLFTSFVESLKPMWAQQARDARELLESL